MLMDYLPRYYKDSKVFLELFRGFAAEINETDKNIEELEAQMFVDTSTWGLDIWEKELGISTDKSKSYESRREAIKAKMRGYGTCTVEMIKNTALAYTNAEVEVIEDNPNYAFVIKFVSVKGIPPDVKAFEETIETIKPAHLTYRLEYSYTTWGELKKTTWGDLKNKTWEEVREWQN